MPPNCTVPDYLDCFKPTKAAEIIAIIGLIIFTILGFSVCLLDALHRREPLPRHDESGFPMVRRGSVSQWLAKRVAGPEYPSDRTDIEETRSTTNQQLRSFTWQSGTAPT
ncbi:hypothetical protein LTR37_008452 [Vermiconidia calcicola]|uniref:Uncharacterized protein n=1 Tax=Vermiconidia calcicola TaxID=1690605 RepID=A0ACC3NAW3_9PEZI|nr:hypothetical protein LTR37_008452 [Vermiconidia calcicola]